MGMMGKAISTALAAIALVAFGAIAQGSEESIPFALDRSASRALSEAPGDMDPALPHRMARKVGSRSLVAAFYHGTRQERFSALDAAASTALPDPFFVLPALAALMGANDRQVASRAADALEAHLGHIAKKPNTAFEIAPGQIAQLKGQLKSLALDRRLDIDIRLIALGRALTLDRLTPEGDGAWLGDLLNDPEALIKRSAITSLTPPFEDSTLKSLAAIATDDNDPAARGYGAAMVCENALVHGVEEPSEDLTRLLRSTLENQKIPVDAFGGVLVCINRFKKGNRQELLDLARAHPNPAVSEFLKTLKPSQP